MTTSQNGGKTASHGVSILTALHRHEAGLTAKSPVWSPIPSGRGGLLVDNYHATRCTLAESD